MDGAAFFKRIKRIELISTKLVESLLAGLSLETAVARVTKPVPHLVIIGLRAELGEVRRYLSKAGAILWPPQGEGDG